MKCIVKRRNGLCEKFDVKKVYGSVYAACYVVKRNEQECEKIASTISKKIVAIVKDKKNINSITIRKKVIAEMQKLDKNAAFMYETHGDVN